MRISKNGKLICSIDSWFEAAPPKGGLEQWVDGRSAKELAKAFCFQDTVAVPPELHSILNSHTVLAPVELTEGWPEHKITLDSFRGETRNTDLAGLGTCGLGTVAISIEAKADESFGGLIGSILAGASTASKVPARIETLAQALFGRSGGEIADLRYQLLHGVAASLIFAREHQADAAAFVVFEFSGPTCSPERLDRNAHDLERFVSSFRLQELRSGYLAGPFVVPGGRTIPSGVPLFIGKAVRKVGWYAA